MAAITSTTVSKTAAFAANEQTLTADDTITFNEQIRQLLILRNPTGGALTATIDGDGGTTVSVPGIGAVSVAAGIGVAVPAGETRCVLLSAVKEYCRGVVHITGATGMKAQLLNF